MLEIFTAGVANNITGEGACSLVIYRDGTPVRQDDEPVELSCRYTKTTNMRMLLVAIHSAALCALHEETTIYTPNGWAADLSAGVAQARKNTRQGTATPNDVIWLLIHALMRTRSAPCHIVHRDVALEPGMKRARTLARNTLAGGIE